MGLLFDVFRNLGGRHGNGGPKSKKPIPCPHDLVIQGHSTGFAFLADVSTFWWVKFKTLQMEGSRTGFAANETPAFAAQEAPVDVDRTLFQIMLRADHRSVSDNLRTSRNASGLRVVRRWTFDAADQVTFGGGCVRAGIVRDARMAGVSWAVQRARLTGRSSELVLWEQSETIQMVLLAAAVHDAAEFFLLLDCIVLIVAHKTGGRF